DPPTPLRAYAPDVPEEVAAAIDQLLATDPAARPGSALEVIDRLQGRRAQAALRSLGPGAAALDEAAMRALFFGPDRILHLREDGARLLVSRTGGDPARVRHELHAWVRAGLARWVFSVRPRCGGDRRRCRSGPGAGAAGSGGLGASARRRRR